MIFYIIDQSDCFLFSPVALQKFVLNVEQMYNNFFQYFPSFSVWPLKKIPLIIFAMISHICMLNEGLRSMECKSQVLEVTIPFIFSVDKLFFTSPEKPFKTDLPALRLRKKS